MAVSDDFISEWLMDVIQASAAKQIRPSCVSVATVLAMKFLNRKSGLCSPKNVEISEASGLPLSTVKEALQMLKERGLLSWERSFFNGPSSYQFTIRRQP